MFLRPQNITKHALYGIFALYVLITDPESNTRAALLS